MLNKKIGLGLILMALMVGSSIASVSALHREITFYGFDVQIYDYTQYTRNFEAFHSYLADLKFYQDDSVVKEYKNLNLTCAGSPGTHNNAWAISFNETVADETNETIVPPAGTTSFEFSFGTINLSTGKIPITESGLEIWFFDSKLETKANKAANGDWIAVRPYIDRHNPLRSSFVAYTVPDTVYDYAFEHVLY
ncbi:MAG: hypothetical protein LBT66_01185 [Methanobrevibacter sp.]|jgi:hypothetical protein|nr:hypothetical protein [Candidatus Methanovirga meridionalis]